MPPRHHINTATYFKLERETGLLSSAQLVDKQQVLLSRRISKTSIMALNELTVNT